MSIVRLFNTDLVLKLRADVTQQIKRFYPQTKQSLCHLWTYRSCISGLDSWLSYFARRRKTQIKYSRVNRIRGQPQKASFTYPELASHWPFLDDQPLLDGMQA